MQGDPLPMITYGIGILPLVNNLKQAIPDVTQPWYADDAIALGALARIETYFDSLTHHFPGLKYHPNPINSVMILRPDNIEAGKVSREHHKFRVCTGARYLGGYIGDDESKTDWLRESTLTWERNINTISKTVGKYPQESYAEVVRAIQSE